MTVLLVHHAQAEDAHIDPQRPLTEEGHQHALAMAELSREHGAAPMEIWHSGKLRGRQTGEAFLRLCAPFAKFKMVRGLSPEDPPTTIHMAVLRETRDLALIGHWPHLPELLRLFLPDAAPMPRHGVVAMRTDDGGVTWKEVWRGN